MIYEKYILRLLFSRFFVICFCTVIFGLLQELTREQTFAFCTFWQTMLILPLMIPMILFLFLPFIYLGSLLLVLRDIYLNNELINFKAIGLSNAQIAKAFFRFLLFILFFFVFIILIYPASNKLLHRQKNLFKGSNLLKALKPNQINNFGRYSIFFTKIDKHGELNDVSIVFNNNKKKNKNNEKKVIFSKTVSLNYNKFNELIAYCNDSDVLTLNFKNRVEQEDDIEMLKYNQNKKTSITAKYVVHSDKMDVSLDDFFSLKNNKNTRYIQKLRQIGLFTLLKIKPNNPFKENVYKRELHGRAVVYWFVLLTITCLSCLLIKLKTNRFSSLKIMLFVTIMSLIVALSRAFVLEFVIHNNMLTFYYIHFLIICIICILFLREKV